MRHLNTVLLLFSLFLSYRLSAAPIIGKIIKLKGKVTGLYPGELKAVTMKKGSKVKEDTSLLSAKGSFAIVKLNDKSKLILGPNSKLIVQYPKATGTGIVTLLKGKVRSSIPKNKSNKIKQVIQTATAAMGVRGTEFQATFNPTSKMTSLLTYNGKVSLVKKNSRSTKKLNLLTSRKKRNKNKVKKKDLENLFKKEAVLVEPGNYSAVSENLKKATEPVNLSPKQFSVLKANDTFLKDKINQDKLKKEEDAIKAVYVKRAKRNKKKANATYNLKSETYKPKDGGYIDLETGIYIPPSKSAKYDKKLNIYLDKDAEKKVSANGDFKAPEGLKLDPKKGFVALNDSKEIQKQVRELNKEIAGQIVKPRKPTFDELESLDDEETYDKFFKVR